MAEKTFKELVKEAISYLPKEPKEDDSTFDELAKLILGRGLLSVNEVKFRFVEIEFYLNNVEDKTSKEGYDLFAHIAAGKILKTLRKSDGDTMYTSKVKTPKRKKL